MPDLLDFDAQNPPRAKLHITAQLDRDLAVYKAGRTRVPWKVFPIKDKETKEQVARIDFNQDGGISFTFNIATAKERSWAISLQALYDCVESADKLYVAEQVKLAAARNAPVAVKKAAVLRASTKTLKQKVKKAKRQNPGWKPKGNLKLGRR